MNSKCSLRACAAAALLCGSVYSQEKENTIQTEENETSLGDFVSAEVSVSFDSKFVSYGLIDNKDPIITPSAHLTFMDFLTFGVAAIYDTTTYGRKAGYSNRGGRYTELDPEVSIGYSFSPEDFSWLPTTIDVSIGYIYEYHPRSMGGGSGEPGDDTQFMFTEICLHDLFLEPTFYYERDIDRDNGTYVNLEIGHTFSIVESESENDDPVLDFRISAAQGFGNSQRVKGYLVKEDGEALDHSGLMDTCLKGTLTWRPCQNFELSGYVAYYDFLFDRKIRHAARDYEATGNNDESYNFVAGLAACVRF